MNADPSPILRTLTGYWSSQVLAAAMRENLFAALNPGPCSATTVADRCGFTNVDLVGAVLEALVELGFVKNMAEGYSPTPVVCRFLLGAPDTPDLRRVHGVFIGTPAPIADAVASSLRNQFPPDNGRLLSTEISDGMEGLTAPVADALANRLAGQLMKAVVDLGGGSGIFSRRLARVLPAAHFLQVDTSTANALARAAAAKDLLGDRFKATEGDILSFVRTMAPADLILCCHILHYFDASEIKDLMLACSRSLDPLGTLVVIDFTQRSQEPKGLFRALFEVFLKAQSPKAGIPSMALLCNSAKQAGFGLPQIISLAPRPSTIFVWKQTDA